MGGGVGGAAHALVDTTFLCILALMCVSWCVDYTGDPATTHGCSIILVTLLYGCSIILVTLLYGCNIILETLLPPMAVASYW